MDKSDLARYLSTPLAISNKTIDARMVLAPMAGLGHVVFRELVAALGGFGLLFTGIVPLKHFPMITRQSLRCLAVAVRNCPTRCVKSGPIQRTIQPT